MADNTENTKDTNWLAMDWLVSNLRWLWLFFAAVFIIFESRLNVTPSPYYRELLILMGTGVALNAVYAGLLWARFFPSSVAVATMILDIAFAIALLAFMIEHAQLLLPLMLFPVIIAGIRWNTEAGLVVALPIVIGYATPLVPMLSTDIDRIELIIWPVNIWG